MRITDIFKPKKVPEISLVVSRDSVCAGDDVDAPHEESYQLKDVDSISAVIEHLNKSYPLAGVAGGNATWLLVGSKPLAVFAQRWNQPKLLVSPGATLSSCGAENGSFNLYFEYKSSESPDEVYRKLGGVE